MAKKSDTDEGTETTEKKPKKDRGAAVGAQVNKTRTLAARIVWALCVFFASVLALGALCVALDFNRDNSLVHFLLNTGDAVDFGIFTRQGGIKDFTGSNADVKNILLNWGICAVVWLVIGRVADRVIRP